MYDEECSELDIDIERIEEMLKTAKEDVHSSGETPVDGYEAKAAYFSNASHLRFIEELERELAELLNYKEREIDVE